MARKKEVHGHLFIPVSHAAAKWNMRVHLGKTRDDSRCQGRKEIHEGEVLGDGPQAVINISAVASIEYADDFCTWVEDATAIGLLLKATKTQLMTGRRSDTSARDVSISVEGKVIKPGERLNLLGGCLDNKLSLPPYECSMALTAKQRAE
eukprot:maker-scaffold895_size84271-snap-gene-0.26 protein:Tk08210 transcript:maker-scaffold895_size84271-snap-gene-0.26-mRNA-1 annotation:"hypothetical protein CHGG_08328"